MRLWYVQISVMLLSEAIHLLNPLFISANFKLPVVTPDAVDDVETIPDGVH